MERACAKSWGSENKNHQRAEAGRWKQGEMRSPKKADGRKQLWPEPKEKNPEREKMRAALEICWTRLQVPKERAPRSAEFSEGSNNKQDQWAKQQRGH